MLEARALTKRYRGVAAVDHVSFAAARGVVTGFLGPNGAGKSTTVKMLIGLVPPSSGEVLFEGRNVERDLLEYKRRLGYVPEEPHVYTYLTGREYLQLVGRLRGLSEKTLSRRIDGFLDLLGLAAHRYSPMTAYSKGMKQKVLIAAALVADPDVLVFDEPLSGLDVTSALVVRHLIHKLAAEGRVVLFSSHVLEVVEKVCSRVIILHKGRLVADDGVGRLRELKNLASLEAVFTEIVAQEDTSRAADDLLSVMKA